MSKFNWKTAGKAEKTACISAVFSLASLIAFLIYGAIYRVYADWTVGLFLALGLVFYFLCTQVHGKAAFLLPLLGVICAGMALNLFFLNSYPVWADWYGNFNMYSSQGDITPVIIIMILIIASGVIGIGTCFMRNGKEEKAK